jgi:hypothetical protein
MLAWVVASLAPFLPVRMSAPRFAIALEIPLCLLFGACLSAAWRSLEPAEPMGSALASTERRGVEDGSRPSFSGGARGIAALALLVLALVATPYSVIRDALENPRGAKAKAVMTQLDALFPSPDSGARFVILHAGPGLMQDAWAIHRETWSGTPMMQARHPNRGITLSFQRLVADAPSVDFAPGVVLLELDPRLGIAPARLETRHAFYERGVASSKPGSPAAAAEQLAWLAGADATDVIVDAARGAAPPEREAIARALLLIHDRRADTAARELIPSPRRRQELRRALEQRGRGTAG